MRAQAISNKEARRIGVSRSTAWRSRKRGYYCPDYHKQYEKPGQRYLPPAEDLRRLAYASALSALRGGLDGLQFHPFLNKDDLASEAVVRALQVGDDPRAGSPAWLFSVMKNTCRAIIKREMARFRHAPNAGAIGGNNPRRRAVNRRCVACGAQQGLTSHHVFPKRHGGKATIPLCVDCHAEVKSYYSLHEGDPDRFSDDDQLMRHYVALFRDWVKKRNKSLAKPVFRCAEERL